MYQDCKHDPFTMVSWDNVIGVYWVVLFVLGGEDAILWYVVAILECTVQVVVEYIYLHL